MAPLRWGARDHPGAVSGDDARSHHRDALVTVWHREEGFTLTAKKRPGPPLRNVKERQGLALGQDRSLAASLDALALPTPAVAAWANGFQEIPKFAVVRFFLNARWGVPP